MTTPQLRWTQLRSINLACLTLLLTCTGCGLGISELQFSGRQDSAEPDLPRHWLVFSHHADSARKDYDIWRIAADGTQLSSLVTLPDHQSQLAVSLDGNEIVFTSQVDGEYDLWHRKFNGGEAVNLTSHPSNDSSPCWSPDGKEILFTSTRDHEKPELYVLNLESKETRRITENALYDSGTAWSPDGKTVLCTRFFPGDEGTKLAGRGEVMSIELATGKETQLTELGGYCGGVDFSPDGKRIAFHRAAEEGAEIWAMDADGQNQQQLTETFLDEYSPAWSPDGGWIAYTSGTESDNRGTFDLWLMRADGSKQHVICKAANTQMNPKWRFGEHFCR